MIGANGYLIKKKFIEKVLPKKSNDFFHIDINLDILNYFKKKKIVLDIVMILLFIKIDKVYIKH